MDDPHPVPMLARPFLRAVSFGVLVTACDVPAQIQERMRDPSSHEAYVSALYAAGLEQTTLAQAWIVSAERALSEPVDAALPLREEGFVDASDPRALAYGIDITRGQRISVEVAFEMEPSSPLVAATGPLAGRRVFVEVFRQAGEATARPFLVRDLPPDSLVMDFRPSRSGRYIVRVQPELLVGGRYTVDVRVLPSLAFPVEGRGPSAVLSRWGAARDGGRRSHRGIDIFAPRGTPALAAAPGRVSRVDTTEIGGYVVWLREAGTDHSLYYAHLDGQAVREGDRVQAGDTVGFVGNTGNARTTPPHLHFGIYKRREGALDPFPFVEPRDSVASPVQSDRADLGTWQSVAATPVRMRSAAATSGQVRRELGLGDPVRVLGYAGSWVRVRLPDRTEGYVPGRALRAPRTLRTLVADAGTPLLSAPDPVAPARRAIQEQTSLDVLGVYEGFGMVREADGVAWVALDG